MSFRPLFNHRDLDGWAHVGPGRFWVDAGTGELRSEEGMGLTWYTRERLGNCVLRVVYKTLRPGSNSGIFVRIDGAPPDPMYAVHHGYEVQILDGEESPFHRTAAVYSLAPAKVAAARPQGEWNQMDVILDGPRIRIELNGILTTDFDPALPVPPRQQDWEPQPGPRPELGFFGLQNHGGAESEVFFKDVLVRPL